MADDKRPTRLDLATAEEISAALTVIARGLPADADRMSLHQQELAAGLLEVRYEGHQMVCRYDAALADHVGWDRLLREQLGAPKADLVRYQPVSTPPAELQALLERVLRFDWHPRAQAYLLAAHIDWQQELLVTTSGAPATDDVARALIELVGARGVVTTGAKSGRGLAGRRRTGR